MSRRPDKPPRKKPRLHELLADSAGQSDDPVRQRFGQRGKLAQQRKIERTALMRSEQVAENLQRLPIGQVVQVYSLYCQVGDSSGLHQCVVRKTLTMLEETPVVVGDLVRFGQGVIEQVLPRHTVLTRADSFHNDRQHALVANAGQMLIVASLANPAVRWNLIDRMIVAARAGGLEPVVCLNKIDFAGAAMTAAAAVLAHYASIGVGTMQTSAQRRIGLDQLIQTLKGKTTVLAGHSGVGKSSLIAAIEPGLDIRVGEVSHSTQKGRHTTTSARRYDLSFGAGVIDTPGVRQFGLWGVTRENLLDFFPDVAAETAPPWRQISYQRIADSLPP